ncbi:predicted protein [Streptomyces sp. C]|nr:predicted protein [Streptomyces sp. C]
MRGGGGRRRARRVYHLPGRRMDNFGIPAQRAESRRSLALLSVSCSLLNVAN